MDRGATVAEGYIARFIRTVYAPALLKRPVKYFVMALFGGLFVLSWVGARHIELGLGESEMPEMSIVAHQDSFFQINALLCPLILTWSITSTLSTPSWMLDPLFISLRRE